MDEVKKPRGFAAMSPEKRAEAIAKGRAKRAENKQAKLAAEPPRIETKDELDRKLDHFRYSLDPEATMMWEHDETVSPLHVPKEIKDRYPHLEWRFVSNRTLDIKGKGYNGWELFHDQSYPEGLKRGPDLRLAAMPREFAESYRRKVQDRSTEQVRNLQTGQIAKMEQAVHDLNAAGVEAGMLGDGEVLADEKGRRREFSGGGINIGARPKVGKGGGYQRGVSRAEIHEMRIKSAEAQGKNKVYAFMGK